MVVVEDQSYATTYHIETAKDLGAGNMEGHSYKVAKVSLCKSLLCVQHLQLIPMATFSSQHCR